MDARAELSACAACGGSFAPWRRDQRFCSAACRKAGHYSASKGRAGARRGRQEASNDVPGHNPPARSVEDTQRGVLIPGPQSPTFLDFGEAIRQEVIRQIAEGQGDAPNPISTSQGMRIWLAYDGKPKIGDAAHYAHAARGAVIANKRGCK